MNVVLPEKNKFDKKLILIYSAIILFCLLSMFIVFYIQFYARINLGEFVGIKDKNNLKVKSE